MLRHDVVAAAAQGQFHIYPVTTADEAMELLSGQIAGQRNEAGNFPEGSINEQVEKVLQEMAAIKHTYSEHKEKEEATESS